MKSAPGPSGRGDPGKERREAEGLPIVHSLDGFRAFAVVGIVFVHTLLFSGAVARVSGTVADDLLIFPRLGVELLFIVSGFVMFLPTAARGTFGDVRSYAVRRAARLVPAAWLVVGLVLVAVYVEPPFAVPFRPGGSLAGPEPLEVLGHLLFLQTPLQFFFATFDRGLGIIGPIWTLSLELIFYLVLPLIAGWWFRRPWLGLALAAGVTLTWHVGFANLGTVLEALSVDLEPRRAFLLQLSSDFQFPSYAFSFAAGMTAAHLYVTLGKKVDRRRLMRLASVAQPLVLLTVIALGVLLNRYAMQGQDFAAPAAIGRNAPLLAIAYSAAVAAFLVATAHARSSQQLIFANRPMAWVADISYGIYLIHYPVLAYLLLSGVLPRSGTVVAVLAWAGVTLAISVLWGYASAISVERPARRLAQAAVRTWRRGGLAESRAGGAGVT